MTSRRATSPAAEEETTIASKPGWSWMQVISAFIPFDVNPCRCPLGFAAV